MAETMTYAEAEAKYDSEWVLFQDPVTDDQLRVLSGKVICHSKDRAEVHRQALGLPPPRHFAVLFVGKPPKDIAYLL